VVRLALEDLEKVRQGSFELRKVRLWSVGGRNYYIVRSWKRQCYTSIERDMSISVRAKRYVRGIRFGDTA
jgi:hypothetical protein